MSESGIYPIASGVAQAATQNPVRPGTSGGNVGPVAGNNPPPDPGTTRSRELDGLVEELNLRSRSIGRSIRFRIDPEARTAIIQVFDRDTGRLIRQIPGDQAEVLASNRGTLNLQRVIDVV